MEFEKEGLIQREIDIATYLLKHFSLKKIAGELAVSQIIIIAHVRNMMQKLHAKNMEDLIRLLKEKQQKK
jgi:DNA-binding NarL/FixJ family response regulator